MMYIRILIRFSVVTAVILVLASSCTAITEKSDQVAALKQEVADLEFELEGERRSRRSSDRNAAVYSLAHRCSVRSRNGIILAWDAVTKEDLYDSLHKVAADQDAACQKNGGLR